MPSLEQQKNNINKTIRDVISLIVKFDFISDFKKEVIASNKYLFTSGGCLNKTNFKEIAITDLFENPIKTGPYHVSGVLDNGEIPLVSCVSENGGFEGFFNVEDYIKNAITIACDGMPLSTFYHFYNFVTKDNVLICKPIRKYKFTTLLFIVTQLNNLKWRFSYGRKCYENKVHKLKIYLPFNNGNIDEDYIEGLCKSVNGWDILKRITEKE
jgi:hypothetical protein